MEEEFSSVELVQMSEEAETTINQLLKKYRNKRGQSYRSHRLFDTLKILNPNKELNMILLQDPKSLLAKDIKKLPDLSSEKEQHQSVTEHGVTISRRNCVDDVCTNKFQKENVYHFLWNKIRSPYGDRSDRRHSPRRSLIPSRIVVLKPSSKRMEVSESVDCDCSFSPSSGFMRNKGKNAKPAYFSFRDIKRTFKCAKGDNRKEQHGEKKIGGKIATKIMQMTDSNSGRKPEIASSVESSPKHTSFSSVSYPRHTDFGIYVEARRHLSERFSHAEKDETFSGKESPRTLGRILSLPYHDFSPLHSPKHDVQSGFVTSQIRFLPYGNLQENETSCLCSLRQKNEASQCADNMESNDQLQIFIPKQDKSENHSRNSEGQESFCSLGDNFSTDGGVKHVETNGTAEPEEFSHLEVPATASSATGNRSTKQSPNASNMSNEFEYLEFSIPDSPSENQQKLEFGDSSSDRTENPSPVSVLQPFYIEEFTSPRTTLTKSANSTMQPRRIDFEEQYECLNLDAHSSRWHSSDQLLSQSFFDELELPSIDSSCDHKLLFDCANEVISEAYECYLSCSPFLSFLKPKLHPVPVDKVVVHEIKKRVNKYLLLSPMVPRRLEQIVGEDMASCTTRMDTQHDTEDIVVQMTESILEELIPEAIP